VDEEWRVSLVFLDPLTTRNPRYADSVTALLRGRVGAESSVTAGKTAIFLYAATADAAGNAERGAREVLTEQGLAADIRLERWDPSRQAWVDVRTDVAAPELQSRDERSAGRRHLRSAGALIAAIVEAAGDAEWPS
jgi:hypothetical protein